MGAVIGYENLIDLATVTTSGTWSGTYPANNVKNRFLGVFARATSASASISFDLDGQYELGVVGMAGLVIPGDTVFTIQASNTNWATSTTIASNQYFNQYGGGSGWFYSFEPASYQYWRISFSAVVGPFDIGRVFLGSRFKPEYGLSFGASMGLESRTTREESAGGARFHRPRSSRRTITGEFNYLSDAESDWFRGVQKTIDISGEAVLIFDDADTSTRRKDRNMLCNMDELSDIEFPYATLRKVGVKFSEIIA